MTSAQEPRLQDDAAERLLCALAGIVSAHIVTGDDGRMVEIHVLATSELHPKQVVRNVESALSAGLGIPIDRRIVSVAQIRTETSNGSGTGGREDAQVESPAAPAAMPGAVDTGRLQYVRYEARRREERCTCSVVLRSGEEEVTGTGDGPDTAAGRAEAAARAVFDAIGRARPALRLKLEGAVITHSRGRSFAIISAHRLLDRATVPLAGAAVLHRSPEEAAILAALQASNRCSG